MSAGFEPHPVFRLEEPNWRTSLRVMYWLACVASFGMLGVGVAALVFTYGGTPLPGFAIGVGAANLVWLGVFGDCVMNRGYQEATHVYLQGQFALLVALLLVASLAIVDIPQAQEYLEENWDKLQADVIPFTTLLDAKRLVSSLYQAIIQCGYAAFLLSLGSFGRAWAQVGGLADMARKRFDLLLPQLVSLLILSIGTAAVGSESVEIATYAIDNDTSSSSLLAAVAAGYIQMVVGFFLLVLPLQCAAHHAVHSIVGLAVLPWALIAVITGADLIATADRAGPWVVARWDTIKIFIPLRYQDRIVDKYVSDASTLMRFTGMLAVLAGMQGLVLAASAICAAFSLAAEDESLVPGSVERERALLSSSAHRGYGSGTPLTGTNSAGLATYHSFGHGGVGSGKAASDGQGQGGAFFTGRDGDEDDEEGDGGSRDQAGAEAGTKKAHSDSEPARSPSVNDPEEGMPRMMSRAGVELTATNNTTTTTTTAAAAAAAAAAGRRSTGTPRSMSGAESPRHPLSAQPPRVYGLMTGNLEGQEALPWDGPLPPLTGLPGPRADPPMPGRMWLHPLDQLNLTWRSLLASFHHNRRCALVALALFVVAFFSIVGGMTVLQLEAKCGALSRRAVTHTYTETFSLLPNSPFVFADTNWARGIVEVRLVPYGSKGASVTSYNVTQFVLDPTRLLSDKEWQERRSYSAGIPSADDDSVSPPENATFRWSRRDGESDLEAYRHCDALHAVIQLPVLTVDKSTVAGVAHALHDRARSALLGRPRSLQQKEGKGEEGQGEEQQQQEQEQQQQEQQEQGKGQQRDRQGQQQGQPLAEDDVLLFDYLLAHTEGGRAYLAARGGARRASDAEEAVHLETAHHATHRAHGRRLEAAEAASVPRGHRHAGGMAKHGWDEAVAAPARRLTAWEEGVRALGRWTGALRAREVVPRPVNVMPTHVAGVARASQHLTAAQAEALLALEASETVRLARQLVHYVRHTWPAESPREWARRVEALDADVRDVLRTRGFEAAWRQLGLVGLFVGDGLFHLSSDYAMINVTGRIDAYGQVGQMRVRTTNAHVCLNSVTGSVPDRKAIDIAGDVESQWGNINTDTVILPGLRFVSGGSLRIATSTSAYVTSGGDYLYEVKNYWAESTGWGSLVVTQGFGGVNSTIRTDEADLLIVNCAGLPLLETQIETRKGHIYIVTYLLAAGDVTTVRSSGKIIKASTVTANRVHVLSDTATFAVYEIFVGTHPPTSNFDPSVVLPKNYSLPGLVVDTPGRPISVVGLGSLEALFADNSFIDLRTQENLIKVEINGGGYRGPYECKSTQGGYVTVEVGGVQVPDVGFLGDSNDFVGNSSMYLETRGGDIQLTLLESAY
jgi:hypothetical protein